MNSKKSSLSLSKYTFAFCNLHNHLSVVGVLPFKKCLLTRTIDLNPKASAPVFFGRGTWICHKQNCTSDAF